MIRYGTHDAESRACRQSYLLRRFLRRGYRDAVMLRAEYDKRRSKESLPLDRSEYHSSRLAA